MKLAIYTSCALNYLPKARALAASIRRHAPNATLTLCLNDVVSDDEDVDLSAFAEVWTPDDLGFDRSWIFQHNVMELCTAVKGRALERLMKRHNADLYLYLDPDVYLFSSLAPLKDLMEGASIGLVPHILTPEHTDLGVRLTEMSVTGHGIYNLGHLIVRKDDNGTAFARWWTDRLDQYCFDDRINGLFTDQRWVDLVPALFDGVKVLRHPGLDVASWNLTGRHIQEHPSGGERSFSVNGGPLITYHFSGTGPTGTHRRVREMFDSCNPATAEIERIYETEIESFGQSKFEDRLPSYDVFDGGDIIPDSVRRLYRDHSDLRDAYRDPYSCVPDRNCFLTWLRQNRQDLVGGIQIPDHLKSRAFHELFDEKFYLENNPSVAAEVKAGRYTSGREHYEKVGSQIMLDPNPFFVSNFYFSQLVRNGVPFSPATGRNNTLLWHYISIGVEQGIEPIEFFDSSWYLASNPDVQKALRWGALTSALGHFSRYGCHEQRDPGPDFSGTQFLEAVGQESGRNDDQSGDARGPFDAFIKIRGVSGRLPSAAVGP